MFNDRRTRFDDKLFLVLLIVPALFAGAGPRRSLVPALP